MNDELKAIDLFAGAGGLSYGLSKNGIKVLLANEIESDFAETYSLNHPKTKMLNCDISKVNFKKQIQRLGCQNIDILCGGPPCQGFSTVGRKKENDRRNSLFWEFLRVIRETKPKVILFENVSGFKTLYKGAAFSTLISELKKYGFETFYDVLDASNFGLPQRRLRTIVVGVMMGKLFTFPKSTHTNDDYLFEKKKLTLMDAISDLPELKSGESKNFYFSKPKNSFQKLMRGDQKTLTEHNATNYGEKMKKILSLIPKNGCVLNLPEDLRPKKYFNNVYARLDGEKICPTITRNFGTPSSSRCIHPNQNRALSTREGARIQSFPDNFLFHGSKTSKNLQIGNAVPPLLGIVLGKEIKKLFS
ncbi:MAG: DNA (cytosine-5-)-methyltransferase [Rickettsiales bacterium]|nr:DNA (cytosine-5-)-methyltransferase [Rickettsiales bacterium]|tara:strand:+ start:160 stop:1242 length:1083 start_codon:yes stop_codon:yes gene_type:complete